MLNLVLFRLRVALSMISEDGGLLFHFGRSKIEHGGGDGDGLGSREGDPRPLKLVSTLPEMTSSIWDGKPTI